MAKIKSKVKRTITIELSPREALALVRSTLINPDALIEDKDILGNILEWLPDEHCLTVWSKEND